MSKRELFLSHWIANVDHVVNNSTKNQFELYGLLGSMEIDHGRIELAMLQDERNIA